MRYAVPCLCAFLLATTPVAAAQTCLPFNPQPDSTRPALPGRMTYQDSGHNALYLFDFEGANAASAPMQIPTAGLSSVANPVFTPDGTAIAFTASPVAGRTNIYYWPIGAPALINLTGAMSINDNEDVRFSVDGRRMVWKQDYGISVAGFSFDANGQPVLFDIAHVVSGTQNTTNEASGPVFSPDNNFIYYFTGSKVHGPQRIQRYSFASNAVTLAFTQRASINYYFPVDPDLYQFLYVSKTDDNPTFDKIYSYPSVSLSSPTDAGLIWNGTDCIADNSDPAPINEDFFIFSRDQNTDNTGYDLYIGQISTGFAWSLSPLHVNFASGQMEGANYTSVPLTEHSF